MNRLQRMKASMGVSSRFASRGGSNGSNKVINPPQILVQSAMPSATKTNE